MLLFELDDSTAIRTRLVAVTAQLRSRVEKESQKKGFKPWTKDKLQQFLAKHDIILADSDLFDMVKKAPLKNIISNISDDQVTFKGIDGESGEQTQKTKEKNKDTVANMAKSAQPLPTTGPAVPPMPDPAAAQPAVPPPM
jgi:hypothetical protein